MLPAAYIIKKAADENHRQLFLNLKNVKTPK